MSQVYVWSGTQARPADTYVMVDGSPVDTHTRAVPYGYRSVAQMLAEPVFYWAHRGGSLDWPEMTMYAYTRAADWGVGALEISMTRTSDGVWMGLHDTTLLRTSGVDLDPRNMTWAQVQEYTVKLSGYPEQPYMTLQELITAYGRSHVLIVDPKNLTNLGGDLLDEMLLRMPKERIIAKSAGNGHNFADMAAARGIATWGYFYDASWTSWKANAVYYDILGMEWNASQTVWTDILSYNKPVVGHIVASAAQASTALDKGAVGLQMSRPMSIIQRTGGET